MSDLKDQVQLEMERQAKLDEMNKQNKYRQTYLTNKKTEVEIERLAKNEAELKRAKETNFNSMSLEEIKKLQESNAAYIEAAREKMPFMNPLFNGVVPFFRKNILLIGGKTGDGKSTTVANIISTTLQQRNPRTGEPMRCLVITNEEKPEDVYNRVTCHIKGWSYVNHDKFSDDQVDTFQKMIPLLAENGRLMVIDNNYNGAFGLTTSVEGIQSIFEGLIQRQEWYDVVLIDYYQNVKYSKRQPDLNEFMVQGLFAAALDGIKNIYPAPIVVMAQVNPNTESDPKPFEFRIKGRKVICDVSTFIMEVVANRKELETNWVIHKSRFNEAVGETIVTGFERGRYIEITPEFIQARAELQSKRAQQQLDRSMRDASPKLTSSKKDED